MKTPADVWQGIKENAKAEWKIAFLTTFIVGILVHFPIMLSDIPNHDGLASMYFDQNMITSGRWFLTVACGISSYFTLPWLIGMLSILYLSFTSVILISFLEVHKSSSIILISSLLVSFPALASTFAYVFTMDGYMLALLLGILAVYFTKKYPKGFILGGICLAFSMGIYQAYLAFTVLLCIYGMIMICLMAITLKDKVKKIAAYLYMGVIGVGFYFIVLKILLKIQGLELSTYQGVNNIPGKERNLVALIKDIYYDFFAFTIKGNILFTNIYSIIGFILLGLIFIMIIVQLCRKKHLFTSVWLYLVVLFIGISIPIGTNIVMVIAPENYHLLMRYQWILFPIIMIAFADKYMDTSPWKEWGIIVAGIFIVFNFIVINQVGYSNLEKKYEKTYAYCIRLLDRIEQTNGYYPGIPIAMIGVVSDQQFPTTDITHFVTRTMIGVSGDSLLYKGSDYQSFIQNYLGATLNILEPDVMETIYYDDIYLNMESFPQEGSVKYVDGMIYVKTENIENIGEGN